jgi:hypothetical protein
MRTSLVLAAALLGGCSVLDQIALNGDRTLDPTKIYLQGFEFVQTTKRDVERYACIQGPLYCDTRGMSVECRCLNAY